MSDIDQNEVRDYQNESAGDAEMDAAIAERKADPCGVADPQYPVHVCGKVRGHDGEHGIWEAKRFSGRTTETKPYRVYQKTEAFGTRFVRGYDDAVSAHRAAEDMRMSDNTGVFIVAPDIDLEPIRHIIQNADYLDEGSLVQAMYILANKDIITNVIETAALQVARASHEQRTAAKEWLAGF